MPETTYLDAINQAMREEMERDERVFLIGEDVGAYGGAFKTSAGLIDRFGPERVIDTPISEMAIIGAASGAALMGMRPIAEMQFIDFITCGYDMLVNFAAMNSYLFGRACPIVVRGPAGGGTHAGAQDRCAGDGLRREGPPQSGGARRQPRALHRAQVPLPPHQGRPAGRGLRRAHRQGEGAA
jgi:pyruvate/2-oxoglutarate/acetoin dehydrogenase E1 component